GAGIALFHLKEFDRCRALADTQFERPDLPPNVRALTADLVGTIILHQVMEKKTARLDEDVSNLCAEGERQCRAALAVAEVTNPQTRASCQGTLACLLIEQGTLQEGEELLRAGLVRMIDPVHRAYAYAYLALVARRRGEDATALLQRARALLPDHPAVARVAP